MSSESHEVRIFAISIRSQRLGLAVLEESLGLLDWRSVYYRGNNHERVQSAIRKVGSLLEFFSPSAIVIGRSRIHKAPNIANISLISQSIRREAALLSIPVRVVSRREVRRFFREFEAKSKDSIAVTLTGMFPELLPKLPPKRKIWHGEHPIMPIFDAAAIAVASLDHFNARDP